MPITEQKASQGTVERIFTDEYLQELNLPRPTLENDNTLLMNVDEQFVRARIIALPDTRLSLHPPDDFTEAQNTSAPYVVMKEGTLYGIETEVPREWYGAWSKPLKRVRRISKERPLKELHRQRESVGLLIQVGSTPLVEIQQDIGYIGTTKLKPLRIEVLAIPEENDTSQTQSATVISQSIVIYESHPLAPEPKETKKVVSNFQFPASTEGINAGTVPIDVVVVRFKQHESAKAFSPRRRRVSTISASDPVAVARFQFKLVGPGNRRLR